jgi:hypothetical protein
MRAGQPIACNTSASYLPATVVGGHDRREYRHGEDNTVCLAEHGSSLAQSCRKPANMAPRGHTLSKLRFVMILDDVVKEILG